MIFKCHYSKQLFIVCIILKDFCKRKKHQFLRINTLSDIQNCFLRMLTNSERQMRNRVPTRQNKITRANKSQKDKAVSIFLSVKANSQSWQFHERLFRFRRSEMKWKSDTCIWDDGIEVFHWGALIPISGLKTWTSFRR